MSMYVSIASTITAMERDNNLATAAQLEEYDVERTPIRTTVAAALRSLARLQLGLATRLDGRPRLPRQAVACP